LTGVDVTGALRLPAPTARKRLATWQEAGLGRPADWLTVARVAERRSTAAAASGDPASAVAWAQVAEIGYLAVAHGQDAGVGREFTRQYLRLRVRLIRRLGHRHGDPVLDADTVIDWFEASRRRAGRGGVADAVQLQRDVPILRALPDHPRLREPDLRRYLSRPG
jgi:hypothetical protein